MAGDGTGVFFQSLITEHTLQRKSITADDRSDHTVESMDPFSKQGVANGNFTPVITPRRYEHRSGRHRLLLLGSTPAERRQIRENRLAGFICNSSATPSRWSLMPWLMTAPALSSEIHHSRAGTRDAWIDRPAAGRNRRGRPPPRIANGEPRATSPCCGDQDRSLTIRAASPTLFLDLSTVNLPS